MIGAKITRDGDIYVPRFEEGFSSLLDEGVVGEFHTTLDLLNVNSKERIAPLSGHVATLIPGGGVAVTVGTTNLVSDPENWIPNTNEHQDTISTGEKFLGCAVAKTIKKTGSTPPSTLIYLSSIAPGETYTASIYVKHLPDVIENARLIFYKESKLASAYAKGTGDWERLEVTYTNNTGSTLEGVYVCYYPAKNQGSITFTAAPQVEKLGFATPVTTGTRPRGILSYPVINSGTEMAVIIKASKPELLQPTGSHHLLTLFNDVSTPYPDTFVLFAENGVNELRFRTRDSEGLSQNDVIITNCWDDKEHMVVAYMNHSPASGRHKKELYFDGELVGYSDPSGMPDLSKAVDTKLGHWNGTGFWGSPISLFSIIDTCTPEFIYNISKSKARLSPKGFFIPGGMEEKHTITFDKAGYFASFSNDLLIRNKIHPTDSIKPNGLDGATKTDYGLIYNTDGSLCATLLPEGGVAVTEGTTNGIQNGNFATGDFTGWTDWNPANGQKSIVIRDGIKYAKIELVSAGENKSFGIQSTKNISVKPGDKVTVSFRLRGDKPNYAYLMFSVGENISISSFIQYTDLPNGESIGEYTWTSDRTADVGFLFGYREDLMSGEFTYAQLEKKPFRTPFVNGTRPAGQLSIPLIKERHSAGNITLSTTITCNGDDYYVDVNTILRVINTDANNAGFYILGTGPIGNNKLKLSYMLNGQLADLYMGISAKNGIKQKLALVVDGKEVYLYQDGSLLWSGTIPEWGTAVAFNRVQFMGVKSQTYENTLISPSVVSPETVEAWHNNPVKIGATLKTKGELKEFCPYVLNKGYFAPLNHGLAFIDLVTENKFIKPLGME